MGRKPEFPVKELLAMDAALSKRIDDWRRTQVPLPNRREAIRQLLDLGLVAEMGSPIAP